MSGMWRSMLIQAVTWEVACRRPNLAPPPPALRRAEWGKVALFISSIERPPIHPTLLHTYPRPLS